MLTNERLYRIAHQGYDTHLVSSAASYALPIDQRQSPDVRIAKTRLRATRRGCAKRSMVDWLPSSPR
jgi:hypothetical protein